MTAPTSAAVARFAEVLAEHRLHERGRIYDTCRCRWYGHSHEAHVAAALAAVSDTAPGCGGGRGRPCMLTVRPDYVDVSEYYVDDEDEDDEGTAPTTVAATKAERKRVIIEMYPTGPYKAQCGRCGASSGSRVEGTTYEWARHHLTEPCDTATQRAGEGE